MGTSGNLIEEYTGSGDTEAKRYVHGARVDEILAMIDANGTHFFHQDALGSTVRLTDGTGNTEESYSFMMYMGRSRQRTLKAT